MLIPVSKNPFCACLTKKRLFDNDKDNLIRNYFGMMYQKIRFNVYNSYSVVRS